ncbi:MAG: hypothetical protein ACK45S_03855, partial [Sphingobacteriales bacterium]
MFKFLSTLFGGSKSEKDIQRVTPLIKKINEYVAGYQQLTNDQLRSKTQEFKARIKEHLTSIDQQILDLNEKADALPMDDINGKDDI